MQMLDATILNTALPQMAVDLRQSPLHMQSVIIAYALTLALFMPLSGYLSDRYGTRNVFIAALALFVLGSALCAAAPNLTMLVIARVIQGMGGAMLSPVPRMVVLRAYEKSQLLSRMNFIIMPALLGPIIGPLLGGYLVDYASWHWIFLVNVPIGLIGIAAAVRIMPDFRASGRTAPHFDSAGFLLFAAAAVCSTLAVELLTHAHMRPLAFICGICGLLAIGYYRRHAAHDSEKALYPPKLGWVRTFRIGILGNLFSRMGMASVPLLLPLLLQIAFGRSASFSGWVLAPIALAALLAKPLIKPIISRFGYHRVLIWNTRLIGLMIISLSLVEADTSLWLLIPLLICMGACNSLQYSSMNTLTLADLRPEQTGSGTSLMAVNQQLAMTFGIALGALLLNWFTGVQAGHDQLHNAFRYTFISIGLITLLSGQIFTRLHPHDGSNLVIKNKGPT